MLFTGVGGNVGISTGEDGVYIIDDQVRQVTGPLLKLSVKSATKPIKFVINIHYHGDHTGGNSNCRKRRNHRCT
jgi:glyoxylase-like metal-dependent hydrolase (beta-lactamase superfamily II)